MPVETIAAPIAPGSQAGKPVNGSSFGFAVSAAAPHARPWPALRAPSEARAWWAAVLLPPCPRSAPAQAASTTALQMKMRSSSWPEASWCRPVWWTLSCPGRKPTRLQMEVLIDLDLSPFRLRRGDWRRGRRTILGCETEEKMERPPPPYAPPRRRYGRDRGCAQDRGPDRSCATTVDRGPRLEGEVGCGGSADQLPRRRAARLLRVGPTQVTEVSPSLLGEPEPGPSPQ